MDNKTSILQPILCIFSAFGRKYMYQDMSEELLFSLLHNRKHIIVTIFLLNLRICITITPWQADITYLFTLWSSVSCKNSLWNVGYYLGHFGKGLPNWSLALGKPCTYTKFILKNPFAFVFDLTLVCSDEDSSIGCSIRLLAFMNQLFTWSIERFVWSDNCFFSSSVGYGC